ncbi:MAG: cupin domain-containing protein [Methylococcaceae bacterium]|nr:cupin domain-containing protein [Methylococcaceae bacterium]
MTTPQSTQESPDEPDQERLNRLLAEGQTPVDPPRREALRSRLLARAADGRAGETGLLTVRLKRGSWQTLKQGVRFKPLWNGPEGASVLIEFAPGAALPAHRHNWAEEGMVLRGELHTAEVELGPGDYQLSPAGSRHGGIESRGGALAFLRGTSLGHSASVWRELLGGILPLAGPEGTTVRGAGDGWIEIAPGVTVRELWGEGGRWSRYYRLQPGARLPEHGHRQDEECMVLEGEIYLGDILLLAGDYQLAPPGSRHRELTTDAGALLFVRGEREVAP